MKLTTQLAVVIGVGIAGIVSLVICLAVFAQWSDGAVIGLATALGAIVIILTVTVRNQAKTAEVLQGQDDKLDQVVHRTNGQLSARDARIAELEDQVRTLGGKL